MKRVRTFQGYYQLMKAITRHDIQEFKDEYNVPKLRVRKLSSWWKPTGSIKFETIDATDMRDDE